MEATESNLECLPDHEIAFPIMKRVSLPFNKSIRMLAANTRSVCSAFIYFSHTREFEWTDDVPILSGWMNPRLMGLVDRQASLSTSNGVSGYPACRKVEQSCQLRMKKG